MRTDKEIAFNLRKQGKSYKEIHRELGMSMSTLSNWFYNVDFSEDIRRVVTAQAQLKSTERLRVLNRARGDLLRAHYEQAEIEALQELNDHINNPLFVSAIAAYWGEGDKSRGSLVRLANTDPQMIKLFMNFLLTICSVPKDKLRLALYIYEDLDDIECRNYWSKHTGLEHFHKTMVLPSRHKTKKLPYGTCTILVANTYLKKKLLFWIDQMPKIVLNMVPEERN
jgi:transcriptional regulator with XRE-family HTH domain